MTAPAQLTVAQRAAQAIESFILFRASQGENYTAPELVEELIAKGLLIDDE